MATALSLIAPYADGASSRRRSSSRRADRSALRAKAKFRAGQAAFDLGHFEEALQDFSEAYKLKPLPAFLFNIAQCHRHLGAFDRAAFFFKRYLALASLYPVDASVVRDLIREVEAKQTERERALAEQSRKAAEREMELARVAAARAEAEAAERRRAELAAREKSEEEARGRALLAQQEMERKSSNSLIHKWWFWTGLGLVAAGAGVTIYWAASPHPESTTLRQINGNGR